MTSLFISYASRDESWQQELDINLASLKRQGLIDAWHDRCLRAGEPIDAPISTQLERANVMQQG